MIFLRRVWSCRCSSLPLLYPSRVRVVPLVPLSGLPGRINSLRAVLLVSLVSTFLLLFTVPVYASVATSSDAERDYGSGMPISGSVSDEEWEDFQERMEDINGNFDDTGLSAFVLDDVFLDYMYYHFRDLAVADIASASNAKKAPLDEVQDVDGVLESVVPYEDISTYSLLSANAENDYVNCVRFDCVVDGTPCTLLFPSTDRASLFIDSDKQLWNVSDSVVQGLVVYDSFAPRSDEGTLVFMAPCLGNNFSNNHNYGSPNYFRRYYWSGGSYDRLSYTDTYVIVRVESAPFTFYSDDIIQYACILIGGAILLCLLKKSLR